ncbi:ParB/RepB/Spo0J family partition protein [Roseateles sp.]|uniref:ParB/RepB/Spo0J family partition protein n=1 Tax=Roseateles sp. TaxID=1971397 RepID=UPI0039EA2F2F
MPELVSVVAYDGPRRGKGRDKHKLFSHGVIAGGRRLRALLLLVKRGRITLDYEVLCAVVPAERAIAVSMAENQGQRPMCVADTVQAFADMVSAGAGVEDIAIPFGLTPLTVKRRLTLATVSPRLFALYRAGDMNMDQLMALSLAETHEKQEAAWECLPVYNRHATTLRQVILGEGVRDSLVRFVGLEAYEQAGGHVIRDLFSSDEAEAQHIGDPTLMHRLAQEKLAAQAEELRAGEGLAWVEASFDHEFELRQRYCPAPTQRREPSAEQAHALGELQRARDEANSQLEAIYDEDEEADNTADRIEALEGLVQAKQMQIDAIEAQLAYCAPDVAELAGAVLSLAQDGTVNVRRNVMRQADYKTWLAAATAAKVHGHGGEGGEEAGQDAVPTKGLSSALCQELTAFKTEALQVALVRKPQVALAALADAMATVLLYGAVHARYQAPTALGVSVQSCNWQLLQIAPAMVESPAHKVMAEAVEGWRERLASSMTLSVRNRRPS